MNKKYFFIFVFCLIGILAFASGSGEKKDEFSGDFAFGGSTTVDPIITAAIEAWKEIHPKVHISYEGVGSSNGVKGVLAKTYTLGAASRDIKSSEKEKGAKQITIALDAVAVVVNKGSVTVSNLTLEQTAKIFSGEITNWKEVGGADSPIAVFSRDEASGTYDCFHSLVLKKHKLKTKGDATVVTSNGDMAAKVGATPNAIGYVGLGFVKEKGLKPLTIDGVEVSIANVKNKSYKIWRNLNVVYTGELGKVEQAFVDYLKSNDGQAIVEDLNFIKL